MEKEFEISQKKVSDVKVSINNPRFIEPAKSEEEAIRKLIELEPKKMFGLIDNIGNDGWMNDMLIFVLNEKQELILMDGNRRLAALKCILNPSLIPITAETEKIRKRCESIEKDSIRNLELYCEVWSKVTDKLYSRIETKHLSDKTKLKWTPMARYRFAKSIGSKYSDWIITFIYYLVDDKKIDNVLFNRVDSYRRIITGTNSKVLAIDNKTGKIGYERDVEIFKDIVDLGKPSGITRKSTNEINNAVIEIIRKNGENPPSEFQIVKEDDTPKSPVVVAPVEKATTKNSLNNVPADSETLILDPKPKGKRLSPSLKNKFLFFIPYDIKVSSTMPEKLKDMIEESKDLNILTHRYSAAILFRSILQLSVDCFIENNPNAGNYPYPSMDPTTNTQRVKNGIPQFEEGLRSRFHSVNEYLHNTNKIEDDIYNAAEKTLKRETTDLIKIMNESVHDLACNVVPLFDLREASKTLLDVIKKVI